MHRLAIICALAASCSALASDFREPWMTVKDQGHYPFCVGHSLSDLLRWHLRDSGRADFQGSAQWIWATGKAHEDSHMPLGAFIGRGTKLGPALSGMKHCGVVPEAQFSSKAITLIAGGTLEYKALAANMRIRGYTATKRLRTALRWLKRAPVVIAVRVDESFRGGIARDCPGEPTGESHAVIALGRKDGKVLVKNSWGTDWGDGGYLWVHESWLEEAFISAARIRL